MKIALDTNILAYAEGLNGAGRQITTRGILQTLARSDLYLPIQVLGELFAVLVRKAKTTPAEARTRVAEWRDAFIAIPTSSAVMIRATDLAADHRLGIWDSVILAAAAEAGCRLLLSEDMQDGFTWGGVTVANPFAETLHPLLPTG